MLIQSFVDPDDAPGSRELARATGRAFAAGGAKA
jgi:hypothetical protein